MDFDPSIVKEVDLDLEEVDEVTDIPGRSVRPEKTGWSLEICKNLAEEVKFPEVIKDCITQGEIATRFLTFYATGNLPNTHTEADVFLAMASIIFKDKAVKSEDLIWNNEMYVDYETDKTYCVKGQTLLSPEDIDNDQTKITSYAESILGIQESIADIDDDSKIIYEDINTREQRLASEKAKARKEEDISTLSAMTSQFLHKFEKGSLKKFVDECAKILSTYPLSKGFNKMHLQLYRVLNYLALTMLRKTIKNIAQMTTAFLKSQYKANIISLVPGKLSTLYAPPTKKCIEVLGPIGKNDPFIKSMISKIVMLWVNDAYQNPKVVGIIGATLLTHTAWNGMGILHLLFEVCRFHSVSWKKIFKETTLSSTMISWKEIINFLKEYQKSGKEDKTVPWSRVIDDQYFMNFTIQRHIALAALLVESAVSAQGDNGILNSKWAMDHVEELEYYHAGSVWLKDQLSGTTGNIIAGNKESAPLAKVIRESKMNATKKEIQQTADKYVTEDDFEF